MIRDEEYLQDDIVGTIQMMIFFIRYQESYSTLSVRDELVISLSKELLGPRRGRTEKITMDPKYEYVTGVLEPEDYTRKKQEELVKKTNSDLEESTDGNKSQISGGHPTEDEFEPDLESNVSLQRIDPRAFPKSMGMAFILDENITEIDVCATWARYKQIDEKLWERIPDFMVLKSCPLDHSKKTVSKKDNVLLEISTQPVKNSTKFVLIRIVNKTPPSGKKLNTYDLIFQSQIRVRLKPGVELSRLPEFDFSSESTHPENKKSIQEERNLTLLYRDRSAYGRGFQCGVLWKEIDPEYNSERFKKYENSPYGWIDLATVDQTQRNDFILSDIRTEFLPVYSISSATDNKSLDRFNAKELAENFSKKFYEGDFLWKIVTEYEKWIEQKKNQIDPRDGFGDLARANLQECETVKQRIFDGITTLIKNDDARLAFCFMNQVMDKQSIWTRQSGLRWRPFQISFILMSLESIVNKSSDFRDYFDLLWYPTGGGKTEAYLGLAIFTMAYRRLTGDDGFDGVSVISRYTLRLLTIQQFRRALKAIMAAEVLRTENWHPEGTSAENLWGLSKFSIGLWVGQSVTPNNLIGFEFRDHKKRPSKSSGAIDLLREPLNSDVSVGDPAQVLECPRCKAILALSPSGISGTKNIFWIVKTGSPPSTWTKQYRNFSVSLSEILPLPNDDYYQAKIEIIPTKNVSRHDVHKMSRDFEIECNVKLSCSHPILPGYFLKKSSVFGKETDFEIRCPNQKCELNSMEWIDYLPTPAGFKKNDITEPFRQKNSRNVSLGIPIHAFTVDDQTYHRCPSMVLATVDKIARLAFEPKGASLFGNVDNFENSFGYFRNGKGNEPNTGGIDLVGVFPVKPFPPPDMIIQDELHLIEGPLGTMVGIYELAIDILSRNFSSSKPVKAKYIGSTATIREAWSQVSSVYERSLIQFPPKGLSASDNFFAQFEERHPREDSEPGRLYMGICTPGTSAQTALKLIWSILLQTPKDIENKYSPKELDRFLTTVGYFNAIRELSASVGLYRQDVPEWIDSRFGPVKRNLGIPVELSSRIDSKELPGILDTLERKNDESIAGVFATSMFGTGVDVDRLGLMIVNGQPKTTANYIQSTGRVGRSEGGLVIDYFRATKPRDLDHYEFFTRYHRAIQRYVEPITVTPFSLRCLERTAGPVSALLLRNSRQITNSATNAKWCEESKTGKHSKSTVPPSGSREMKDRSLYPEVQEIIEEFENRSMGQPPGRLLPPTMCENLVSSEISRWSAVANKCSDLLYSESAFLYTIQHNVVLGDDRHDDKSLSVYESAPQSLRSVESTTRFDG